MKQKEMLAVRMLISLRGTGKDKMKTCFEIAKECETSTDYVEQISRELIAAGLMASKRGRNGGFYETKYSSLISLWDVRMAIKSKCIRDRDTKTSRAIEAIMKPLMQSVSISDVYKKQEQTT